MTSRGVFRRVKERRPSADGVNWEQTQTFNPRLRRREPEQQHHGMGRAMRSTNKTGDATWVATATEYDGAGRVTKVTNPYETSDYTGAVPQGAS